jgi:hypothetical protein
MIQEMIDGTMDQMGDNDVAVDNEQVFIIYIDETLSFLIYLIGN